MRYLDLVADSPLAWGLFGVYLVGTTWLAWLGHKKTTDIESFAVGRGDMHPVVVGVTLAASIASAATFVLNPGLVYLYGLSALIHLGVAAAGGVLVGLFVLSFGFRRLGQQVRAITLPQWVGQRYGSRALTVLFALINLFSITFMVLIVAGLAIVMQLTLGLSNTESVVLIVGFVFSYIFMGGTYAHAYTNTLQGMIMVVIATIVVVSGLPLLADGLGEFTAALVAQDPNLVETIHPTSPFYGSLFSVWIAGFVIGFALVCQPHILTKALYVKDDRALMRSLLVSTGVSLIFTALLLVGLYARAADIDPQAFLDPVSGMPRADIVVTVYITESFGPITQAIIAVALLAAGMSTLDGILVALSSIAANDLFLELTRDNLLRDKSPAEQSRIAHRAGQVILIALGLVTLVIALNPPELISIFGQVGVFGMVAVAAAPIVLGIYGGRGVGHVTIMVCALSGLATYVGLYAWGQWAVRSGTDLRLVAEDLGPLRLLLDTEMFQLGLLNPAVPATYAVLVSFVVALPGVILARRHATSHTP